MTNGLTENQRQKYMEQGYLLLDNLYDPARLDPLIDELTHIIDRWAHRYYEQKRLADMFEGEPFDRRFFRIHEAMNGACSELNDAVLGKRKTAGMFHVMALPEILDVVQSLIGPEILVHPQFNCRAKFPDRTSVVDWHQDIGFLDAAVLETFMVNFWVPLVDSNADNGCLEVIKGSHRSDRLPFAASPEQIDDASMPEGERICCPVPVGGALLLQHTTVHRSTPNYSDHIRWSLDIRHSDWRQPTGRDEVPGNIARSDTHPDRIAASHVDWLAMFESV